MKATTIKDAIIDANRDTRKPIKIRRINAPYENVGSVGEIMWNQHTLPVDHTKYVSIEYPHTMTRAKISSLFRNYELVDYILVDHAVDSSTSTMFSSASALNLAFEQRLDQESKRIDHIIEELECQINDINDQLDNYREAQTEIEDLKMTYELYFK